MPRQGFEVDGDEAATNRNLVGKDITRCGRGISCHQDQLRRRDLLGNEKGRRVEGARDELYEARMKTASSTQEKRSRRRQA